MLSTDLQKVTDVIEFDQRYAKGGSFSSKNKNCFILDQVLGSLENHHGENLVQENDLTNLSTDGPSKKPAANVWSHKRKEKLKHITDMTSCKCGAGKNLSFLYDVPQPSRKLDLNKCDSTLSLNNSDGERRSLTRTLDLNRYNLVVSKPVKGIEYFDDQYTVVCKDHDCHPVHLPALKPSSRYETLVLKDLMDVLMEKAGVNNDELDSHGPTQLHNLLQLVKKEQNIYNTIFYEVIQQCTVDCLERGELLSELRQRYQTLLCQIPQLLKGLHDEVLAQRSLDRRLTEELFRFKATISLLTNELNILKEHESRISLENEIIQKELHTALDESANHTALVHEYHTLYELQRGRLENLLKAFASEKDMWCKAATDLAAVVADESQLIQIQWLLMLKMSWLKLANHFTALLYDTDAKMIVKIHGYLTEFYEKLHDFDEAITEWETDMLEKVKLVQAGIQNWNTEFRALCIGAKGQIIAAPSDKKQEQMLSDIEEWEKMLSYFVCMEEKTMLKVTESYVGELPCNSMEQIQEISQIFNRSAGVIHNLFSRHSKDSKPMQSYQETIENLGNKVNDLCSQYTVRITGDNGVANGIALLINTFETWDSKLALAVRDNIPVPHNHWESFKLMLDEWQSDVLNIIRCIGLHYNEREMNPTERQEAKTLLRDIKKWQKMAISSLESENAKHCEEVTSMHNTMVFWMIQVLLLLAPNKKGNSAEINSIALDASDSPSNLGIKLVNLKEEMTTFSDYIYICCQDIVNENVRQRSFKKEALPDLEMFDLQRLPMDCVNWINTAQFTLGLLSGESVRRASHQAPYDEFKEVNGNRTEESVQVPSSYSLFNCKELRIDCKEFLKKHHCEGSASTASLTYKNLFSSQVRKIIGANEKSNLSSFVKEIMDPRHLTNQKYDEKFEFLGRDENTHCDLVGLDSCLQSEGEGVDELSRLSHLSNMSTPVMNNSYEAWKAVENLQAKLIVTEQRAREAEYEAEKIEIMATQQKEELDFLKDTLKIDSQMQVFSTYDEMTKVYNPVPEVIQPIKSEVHLEVDKPTLEVIKVTRRKSSVKSKGKHSPKNVKK